MSEVRKLTKEKVLCNVVITESDSEVRVYVCELYQSENGLSSRPLLRFFVKREGITNLEILGDKTEANKEVKLIRSERMFENRGDKDVKI